MNKDFRALPPNLLPHRGPALLVDEVAESEDDGVTVRARLAPESAYARAGRVASIVTLDVAAQAAAVLEAQHGELAGGMLVRLREARIEIADFEVGSEVSVQVERINARPPLYSYRASSSSRGQRLASFEFSLVAAPPPALDAATPLGMQTTGGDTRG